MAREQRSSENVMPVVTFMSFLVLSAVTEIAQILVGVI